jgi:rubrerythrin
MQNPKYDRDNLVNLLAERATFERSAVTLYDAMLSAIQDVEHPLLLASMDTVKRHRDEEEEHAVWTEELLAKLGGRPERDLPDAVNREARALADIIQRGRRAAALLPIFHAMLSSELMDVEGWMLLSLVANELDDRPAMKELQPIIARENEHLALVRQVILTLTRESVTFEGAMMGGMNQGMSAGMRGDGGARRGNGGARRGRPASRPQRAGARRGRGAPSQANR